MVYTRLFYVLAICLTFIPTNKVAYGKEQQDLPIILVNIAPYKCLLQQIVQNTCDIQIIVSATHDPHTYEPTPKQIQKFKNSSLWFLSGDPLEKICAKIVKCPTVNLSTGIDLIPLCSHQSCSQHTDYDNHFWLSPKNLKIITQNMLQALVQTFPHHAPFYQKNYTDLMHKINLLEKQVLSLANNTKNKSLVVSHNAFAYLSRDYHFTIRSIEKKHSVEPSPKDILKLVNFINDNCISSIFLLKNGEKRSSKVLSKKLKMNTIVLNPYSEDILNNILNIVEEFSVA